MHVSTVSALNSLLGASSYLCSITAFCNHLFNVLFLVYFRRYDVLISIPDRLNVMKFGTQKRGNLVRPLLKFSENQSKEISHVSNRISSTPWGKRRRFPVLLKELAYGSFTSLGPSSPRLCPKFHCTIP
jgi:hypothetical protein